MVLVLVTLGTPEIYVTNVMEGTLVQVVPVRLVNVVPQVLMVLLVILLVTAVLTVILDTKEPNVLNVPVLTMTYLVFVPVSVPKNFLKYQF